MKQFGIDKPFMRSWRQRIWYVSKLARDLAFKKLGGKKVSRERPE